MTFPFEHVLIILGVIALWSMKSALDAYSAKLKIEMQKGQREQALLEELDELAREYNELSDTFKMYNDLGNKEKCKEIHKECCEINNKYSALIQRLKA